MKTITYDPKMHALVRKGLIEDARRALDALLAAAPQPEERAIWCGHCGEGTIPGLCRGKVPFAGCPAQPAPTPELPPLPEIDPAQCIPYESIRYIAGFSEDFVKQYAQDYARAALDLHAKRGSEAPLPDERAAFEDLLDAAEEWERFVDVDRAPMNLRKWLERAALAQRSAETSEVRALREENARLRGDCVEWLCARCQTIHPSQRGRTFLQPCPECGEAMEPTSFNIRALKRMDAIIEAARAALEALELHAKQYPHMQKGYTVDAIDALRAALPAHQKEGGQQG